MKRIAFILICVLLCSGCASVPSVPVRMYGPKYSKDKVAVIKTFERERRVFFAPKYAYSAIIEEINGQKVNPSCFKASLGGYEVLPGIHTVKCYVWGNYRRLYYEKTINAKAGHQYSLRADYTTKYGDRHVIKISIIDTKIQ